MGTVEPPWLQWDCSALDMLQIQSARQGKPTSMLVLLQVLEQLSHDHKLPDIILDHRSKTKLLHGFVHDICSRTRCPDDDTGAMLICWTVVFVLLVSMLGTLRHNTGEMPICWTVVPVLRVNVWLLITQQHDG